MSYLIAEILKQKPKFILDKNIIYCVPENKYESFIANLKNQNKTMTEQLTFFEKPFFKKFVEETLPNAVKFPVEFIYENKIRPEIICTNAIGVRMRKEISHDNTLVNYLRGTKGIDLEKKKVKFLNYEQYNILDK